MAAEIPKLYYFSGYNSICLLCDPPLYISSNDRLFKHVEMVHSDIPSSEIHLCPQNCGALGRINQAHKCPAPVQASPPAQAQDPSEFVE